MGERQFKVVYGNNVEIHIYGEKYTIDEDGCLDILNADIKTIATFNSITWLFIEDVTVRAHKDLEKIE